MESDNGWISGRALPNWSYSTYSYNPVGMLTGLTNKKSDGTTLSSFGSFSYDGVFNLTGMSASFSTYPAFSGSTSWSYDTKDRLLNETSSRGDGWNHSNAWDAASNPTTFTNQSRSYNQDNQLTTGSNVFDGNGNPTTYAGATCTYDVENRVTAIGSMLTNGYRSDGLRAWKQGSTGGKTYFLYDGGNPVLELDSSGNVKNINVFAPDGLVARKTGSSWSYYTFDHQGNMAHRLSSNQTVLGGRIFNAWGNGAETVTPPQTDPWGFNSKWGYYYDRESQLYLCQHRMYDASTGRFLNRDPIGYAGGLNLYGYCGGGPVGSADPSGFSASADDWVQGIGAGVAVTGAGAAMGAGVWALAAAFGLAFPPALLVVGVAAGAFYAGQKIYEAATGRAWSLGGRGDELSDRDRIQAGTEGVLGLAGLAGGFCEAIPRGPRSFSHGVGEARSTYRTRHWKARAREPGAVSEFGPANVDRMKKGLAPQRANPAAPNGIESKELAHDPIAYRGGGTRYIELWPQEHAAIDPWRRPGY